MTETLSGHLRHLQDESVFILREAASEFERVVLMLISKDSAR